MIYIVKDPLYRSLRFSFVSEKKADIKFLHVKHKFFPDGESYVRFLDDIDSSGKYYVISAGYPEQDSCLMRTALIVGGLKERGVEDIYLIIPYFPYARQDKEFIGGEVVSTRVIARMLFDLGVKKFFTIDVHNPEAYTDFGDRFINVSSMELWVKFLSRLCRGKKCSLVAPDEGRKLFVGSIADSLGVYYTYFRKVRDLEKGTIIQHEAVDLSGYEEIIRHSEIIFILDDIIATGGTLSSISKKLRDDGFKRSIYVGATHGLFLGDAVDRLYFSGVNSIVTTDTVDNPFIRDELSVVPLLFGKVIV